MNKEGNCYDEKLNITLENVLGKTSRNIHLLLMNYLSETGLKQITIQFLFSFVCCQATAPTPVQKVAIMHLKAKTVEKPHKLKNGH